MNILTFDTSFGIASIALKHKDNIIYRKLDTPNSQASMLIPTIKDILNNLDLELTDIDRIITTNGPGSFTGLRIGLTVAHTLANITNIDIYSISTLECLAYGVKSMEANHSSAISILRAGKGEAYIQSFNISDKLGEEITPTSDISLKKLSDINSEFIGDKIVLGNCKQYIADENIIYNDSVLIPDAKYLLFADGYIDYKDDKYSNLDPLYIREPDAKPSK